MRPSVSEHSLLHKLVNLGHERRTALISRRVATDSRSVATPRVSPKEVLSRSLQLDVRGGANRTNGSPRQPVTRVRSRGLRLGAPDSARLVRGGSPVQRTLSRDVSRRQQPTVERAPSGYGSPCRGGTRSGYEAPSTPPPVDLAEFHSLLHTQTCQGAVHCTDDCQHSSVSILQTPPRVLPPRRFQTSDHPRMSSYRDASTPRFLELRNVELRRQVREPQGPLKLVVFDFDCTLSAFHVFSSLAGCSSTKRTLPVPSPHACTELGQLRRLAELDADPAWGPGAFALKAFGGAERVARLRSVLETLADAGVDCVICSRGMVGPMRKCLDQLNLLLFFSHFFADLGSSLGSSKYDREIVSACSVSDEAHYLGNADMDVGGAFKSEIISKCVKERNLKPWQVAYLDDDLDEVKAAFVVCTSIHVPGCEGMCSTEFDMLRGMIHESCADTCSTTTLPSQDSPFAPNGLDHAESCEQESEESASVDIPDTLQQQSFPPEPHLLDGSGASLLASLVSASISGNCKQASHSDGLVDGGIGIGAFDTLQKDHVADESGVQNNYKSLHRVVAPSFVMCSAQSAHTSARFTTSTAEAISEVTISPSMTSAGSTRTNTPLQMSARGERAITSPRLSTHHEGQTGACTKYVEPETMPSTNRQLQPEECEEYVPAVFAFSSMSSNSPSQGCVGNIHAKAQLDEEPAAESKSVTMHKPMQQESSTEKSSKPRHRAGSAPATPNSVSALVKFWSSINEGSCEEIISPRSPRSCCMDDTFAQVEHNHQHTGIGSINVEQANSGPVRAQAQNHEEDLGENTTDATPGALLKETPEDLCVAVQCPALPWTLNCVASFWENSPRPTQLQQLSECCTDDVHEGAQLCEQESVLDQPWQHQRNFHLASIDFDGTELETLYEDDWSRAGGRNKLRHQVWCLADLVFCIRCGVYAHGRKGLLGQACRGSAKTRHFQTAKENCLAGKHPSTGVHLGVPIASPHPLRPEWRFSKEGDQASFLGRGSRFRSVKRLHTL